MRFGINFVEFAQMFIKSEIKVQNQLHHGI
jgi:hypothetical protein